MHRDPLYIIVILDSRKTSFYSTFIICDDITTIFAYALTTVQLLYNMQKFVAMI